MISNICYIYGLADPLSGVIRYIGKSKSVDVRYKAHLTTSRNPANHKEQWIASLRKVGLVPELVILETVSELYWQEAERRWIAEYRERGVPLTNFTDGGDDSPMSGRNHTSESIEKMRLAKLDKPQSAEMIEKRRLACIGKAGRKPGHIQSQEEKDKRVKSLKESPAAAKGRLAAWTPERRKLYADRARIQILARYA